LPDVLRFWNSGANVRFGLAKDSAEFRLTVATVFVDKVAGVNADGSLARPFNNISNPAVPNALGSVSGQDIVRIVGNGGQG